MIQSTYKFGLESFSGHDISFLFSPLTQHHHKGSGQERCSCSQSAQAGVSEGSTHVTQGGAKVGWGGHGEAQVSTSTAQGEPSESPTTPVTHTYIYIYIYIDMAFPGGSHVTTGLFL